jgi:hypothetical protein
MAISKNAFFPKKRRFFGGRLDLILVALKEVFCEII